MRNAGSGLIRYLEDNNLSCVVLLLVDTRTGYAKISISEETVSVLRENTAVARTLEDVLLRAGADLAAQADWA